MIKELQ